MFVEEINAKGGVLGRKFELVVRDTKGNADEAVRVARDLILRENVEFLVGTLTSAEGPAVSPVAKENKIVFVVPVVKTDVLTKPENLHPYIFRTASNTTIEGRTAAEILSKWNVKRVATMSPDYAFGQDVTRAFVDHLKKLRPDIEIVDQQWPKLGEADYTPFINAQMAKKPEAVFSSLWGGHFVTFAKQAKPLRYYESVGFNVLAAGEAGAIETAKAMGDDYPYGVTANAYDAFNWEAGPPRTRTTSSGSRFTSRKSTPPPGRSPATSACRSWPKESRRPEAPTRTRSPRPCSGMSVDTPIGRQVVRAKDHQANRAQFWGKMTKDPQYPFAVMTPPVYIDPAPFMD